MFKISVHRLIPDDNCGLSVWFGYTGQKILIPDGEKLKKFLHIGKWNFMFPEQGQSGPEVQDAAINLGTFYTVLTRTIPLALGSIPENGH
jgi:hypothetical protein